MFQILKQLGFIDNTCTMELKGRVSCEISNHELVLTELVFDNMFSTLEPEEIVALLSCTVFQNKIDDDDDDEGLSDGIKKVQI